MAVLSSIPKLEFSASTVACRKHVYSGPNRRFSRDGMASENYPDWLAEGFGFEPRLLAYPPAKSRTQKLVVRSGIGRCFLLNYPFRLIGCPAPASASPLPPSDRALVAEPRQNLVRVENDSIPHCERATQRASATRGFHRLCSWCLTFNAPSIYSG
jgi:hypothetical protein